MKTAELFLSDLDWALADDNNMDRDEHINLVIDQDKGVALDRDHDQASLEYSNLAKDENKDLAQDKGRTLLLTEAGDPSLGGNISPVPEDECDPASGDDNSLDRDDDSDIGSADDNNMDRDEHANLVIDQDKGVALDRDNDQASFEYSNLAKDENKDLAQDKGRTLLLTEAGDPSLGGNISPVPEDECDPASGDDNSLDRDDDSDIGSADDNNMDRDEHTNLVIDQDKGVALDRDNDQASFEYSNLAKDENKDLAQDKGRTLLLTEAGDPSLGGNISPVPEDECDPASSDDNSLDRDDDSDIGSADDNNMDRDEHTNLVIDQDKGVALDRDNDQASFEYSNLAKDENKDLAQDKGRTLLLTEAGDPSLGGNISPVPEDECDPASGDDNSLDRDDDSDIGSADENSMNRDEDVSLGLDEIDGSAHYQESDLASVDNHNMSMDGEKNPAHSLSENDISSDEDDDFESWGSFTLGRRQRQNRSLSLSEGDIVRDPNIPGIYIRKHKKSTNSSAAQAHVKKQTNTRVYDNYHACYFCGEMRQHINIHMRKHRSIPDVKRTLEQTKPDFSKLRKLGDHKHNKEVLRRGTGEIILSRRPESFCVNDYGPCPDCKDWVLLKNMKRHLEVCSKKKVLLTKRQVIIISLVEAGAITCKPSELMLKEVFPSMLSDDVGEVAKGDEAIVALGESWLRRCIDNKEKRKHYTSQHMRLMARVLMELRKIDHDQTKTFYDYLNPKSFDKIVAAVLECCFPYMDDIEELKSPSNGIKLKYDLRRMLTARWAMLVKIDPKSEAAKEVQICLELLNIEWGERILKLARAVMTRRQMAFRKELPAPQDVLQLTVYVTSELKSIALTVQEFSRITQLAQTRLLMYNKRRSGEIDAIRLRSYAGRTRNLDELDQSLVGELTRVEQHLLKTQDLMKVRGKGNRPVPVLIPEDLQAPLEFIASVPVRRDAGIPSNNDFLFPVHGKSSAPSYSRSYTMLKKTCEECTLLAPSRITSVSMRKYTATLTQMLNLDKYQMEWVCRHLGHSDNVHRTHYRQMSDMIERVHVTKLLLLQDMNLTKKYKGQKLEDIDITEIVFPETGEVCDDGQPLLDTVNETFPEHERNEVPADEEIFHEMSESETENPEDYEEYDEPKKSVKHTRQRWDSVETKEINSYFKRFLDAGIVPRTKDVQMAQKKSKKNSGKIWMRSVDKIVKKISAMNHKK